MSNFKKQRLDKFCQFRGGIGFSESLQGQTSGTYPFIKVSDMNLSGNERLIKRANNYITKSNSHLLKAKPFPAGSTVFAKVGAALLLNRRRLLTTTTFIDNNMMAAIPTNGANSAFLFYLLQILDFGKFCQVGAVPSVNQADLSSIKVYFPALPEQKKIAEILGTCDEAIEAQERLIKLKQDRKKGLMQQLLTGKKRFPGHFQRPWREVKLGAVLKHVFRPVAWSAELDLNLVSIRRRAGGLFKRPEMKGSEFKTSDLHEIRTNDFLISKRQVSHGAMAVVQPEFEGGMVSKEYTIFENKDPKRLHMPFMGWLAQTREMWHKAYVASNGVVIEKLIFTPKDFLKFKISLPPAIEEQIQIAEFLDAVQEEIDVSMRKLEGLNQQKKGLMQQLLTGKVRVKV